MTAVMERNERPCMVMGYTDSALASKCGRLLRRQGWEVHFATNGPEVMRLVHDLRPEVAMIDVDLPEPTWTEIFEDFAQPRVILLESSTDRPIQRAYTVTRVARSQCVEFLAEELSAHRTQAMWA